MRSGATDCRCMGSTCGTRQAWSCLHAGSASSLPRLDYILNNACQTVRRPAGFFRHLLEREAQGAVALPDAQRAPLSQHQSLCRALVARNAEGLVHSAALSQRR